MGSPLNPPPNSSTATLEVAVKSHSKFHIGPAPMLMSVLHTAALVDATVTRRHTDFIKRQVPYEPEGYLSLAKPLPYMTEVISTGDAIQYW